MTTVTWTTAPIPADQLAVGDHVNHGKTVSLTGVRVCWVDTDHRHTAFGTTIGSYQVPRDQPIAVFVPDEPVDGYGLWQPKPGVWAYSGCTCVHRRHPEYAGNWEAIGRDCPACLRLSDPHEWDD